jgi:hypothetical protein
MPDSKKPLFTTDKSAWADSVLVANKDKDWVKRLYEQNAPSIQVTGEPDRSTHLMSDDGKGYVFPSIIRLPNGQLQPLSEDQAYDYAKKTNTGIQLPPNQGSWFAANGYKTAPNINNSISPNGIPYNNPNFTIENTQQPIIPVPVIKRDKTIVSPVSVYKKIMKK